MINTQICIDAIIINSVVPFVWLKLTATNSAPHVSEISSGNLVTNEMDEGCMKGWRGGGVKQEVAMPSSVVTLAFSNI